jgi:NIMA (never in mitosis gene a)-related kinase
MWSLGVILYELCALEPPFKAGSLLELARTIVMTDPKLIPAQYS